MGVPTVSTEKILLPKVPIQDRKEDKLAYVVAAVSLPAVFMKGDTALVTAHIQTSNPNDEFQLTSPGLYACSDFKVGKGYNNKGQWQKIVETMGPNVQPRRHHEPFHIAEVFGVGNNRIVILVVQGNIRDRSAPDSTIEINEATVTVTRLG